jgi:hypothetical protein
MVAGLCRLDDGDLGVGMKGAVAACRCDHDRAVVACAEDVGAGIDPADIGEPPRTQLEFPKTLAVGAQRQFIVGAGCHVAEMRGRHILLHRRLEVEHVERLARIGDQPVEVARRPVHRIVRPYALRQRAMRDERARGEELQQAAPACGLNVLPRHRYWVPISPPMTGPNSSP